MDKKTQNKIIIGSAIAAIAGVVIWKWDKISEIFKSKDKKDAGQSTGSETGTSSGSGTQTTPYTQYQLKVMKLQGIVGTGIDGNAGGAGSDTNLKTKNYFPISFEKLGLVSPSNIDAYLALGTKRETSSSSLPAYAQLWDKMTKQGASKPATLTKDIIVTKAIYNPKTSKFEFANESIILKSGTKFWSGDVKDPAQNLIPNVPYWVISTPQGNVWIKWSDFNAFIVS